MTNDISDDYRKALVEGLDQIANELPPRHPALCDLLKVAAEEIRLLDRQLQQSHELIRKAAKTK
jgi:hypothetical protein